MRKQLANIVFFALVPFLLPTDMNAGAAGADALMAAAPARHAMVVKRLDAASAVADIRRQTRRVVTFLGFSAAGYEDPDAVARTIERALSALDPTSVIVCVGATAEGIGAAYPIAKRRGFSTIGIVSSLAESEGVRYSPQVDTVYVIADTTWGGKLPDGTLSPVSSAIVHSADEMIAIGGGDIGRDEAAAALALGKPVRFVAADMNHAAAQDKARAKQQPVPSDFRGTLHTLFPGQ